MIGKYVDVLLLHIEYYDQKEQKKNNNKNAKYH